MTMDDAPRDGVLRTPEARFATIDDFPWPASYFAVEPGLRMAYYDVGPPDSAETILLLHGEPMWGYLYRKMIGPLAAAGHRVVVPDLIGFGRSDKPTEQSAYTYSAHVGWVARLIEHLDLGHVTLFGQDWGGLIGGRVVAENETRVARAVFSNTGLPGSGPAIPGLRAQAQLSGDRLRDAFGIDWRSTVTADDRIDAPKVRAWVAAGTPLYFLAWRVYSQQVPNLQPSKVVSGWCVTPPSAAALTAYDAPFPTEAYAAGARRFPMLVPITADDVERINNDAAWRVLEKWRKPVLTLWGSSCPFTYADLGRSFQTRIPGAQLPGIEHKVYPAGHFIQEDVGETLAEEMLRFIANFR